MDRKHEIKWDNENCWAQNCSIKETRAEKLANSGFEWVKEPYDKSIYQPPWLSESALEKFGNKWQYIDWVLARTHGAADCGGQSTTQYCNALA